MLRDALLTHNHFVLSANGWISIDELQLGEIVIGVKNNLMVPSKITTLSHVNYNGVVRYYTLDSNLVGKNLVMDTWSRNPDRLDTYELFKFKGELFSIKTQTNNFIVRYETHTQDYTLLLCQTAG